MPLIRSLPQDEIVTERDFVLGRDVSPDYKAVIKVLIGDKIFEKSTLLTPKNS